MSNVSSVLEEMDQVTFALEALPAEEWADLVICLLESLEEEVGDEEYRDFLEALRLAITTRLEENIW
jgi:hypothetical protein